MKHGGKVVSDNRQSPESGGTEEGFGHNRCNLSGGRMRELHPSAHLLAAFVADPDQRVQKRTPL
jgi:hypothetical protein